MITMIQHIYIDRLFFVRDGEHESSQRHQCSGIIQGCPLSPFLFTIAMTVLMNDVQSEMINQYPHLSEEYRFSNILYADDVLLMHDEISIAQFHVDCIRRIGKEYGLQFNEDKLEVLAVNSHESIVNDHNVFIEPKTRIQYLGATLSSDGRVLPEVTRRIGMADHMFKQLQRVWNHADIPKQKKVSIYNACIVPKLIYALQTC